MADPETGNTSAIFSGSVWSYASFRLTVNCNMFVFVVFAGLARAALKPGDQAAGRCVAIARCRIGGLEVLFDELRWIDNASSDICRGVDRIYGQWN